MPCFVRCQVGPISFIVWPNLTFFSQGISTKPLTAVSAKAKIPVIKNEIFDFAGEEYLEKIKDDTKLIIMDELGFLEKDAAIFEKAVIKRLKGDIPILGVIKAEKTQWHRL